MCSHCHQKPWWERCRFRLGRANGRHGHCRCRWDTITVDSTLSSDSPEFLASPGHGTHSAWLLIHLQVLWDSCFHLTSAVLRVVANRPTAIMRQIIIQNDNDRSMDSHKKARWTCSIKLSLKNCFRSVPSVVGCLSRKLEVGKLTLPKINSH